MLDFAKAPVVPANRVYAERRVGRQAGNVRLMDLVKRGEIAPVVTPTGVVLLTPPDAERLFRAFDE